MITTRFLFFEPARRKRAGICPAPVLTMMHDPPLQLARYLPAAEKVAEVELQERLADVQASFEHRRRLVADYFRRTGEVMHMLAAGALPAAPPPSVRGNGRHWPPPRPPAPPVRLPPRQRQVLARLLVGDSEKQIAYRLELSPHTVHDHVRRLYRTFNASSRGELLARFVRTSAQPADAD